MPSIGERLKDHREKLGINQRTFAKQMGISASFLCALELEQVAPRRRFIESFAKALGVPVEALAEDIYKRKPFRLRPVSVEGEVGYVPLTRSAVALIDAGLAAAVQTKCAWQLNAKGYVVGAFDGHGCLLHRFVWRLTHGKYPETELDHRNHNRLDCRLSNLRLATHSQNTANKVYKPNPTGYKGVLRKGRKFGAEIKKDGKHYWLGVFQTAEAAAHAYDAMAVQLFGEFASINFPLLPS